MHGTRNRRRGGAGARRATIALLGVGSSSSLGTAPAVTMPSTIPVGSLLVITTTTKGADQPSATDNATGSGAANAYQTTVWGTYPSTGRTAGIVHCVTTRAIAAGNKITLGAIATNHKMMAVYLVMGATSVKSTMSVAVSTAPWQASLDGQSGLATFAAAIANAQSLSVTPPAGWTESMDAWTGDRHGYHACCDQQTSGAVFAPTYSSTPGDLMVAMATFE